MSRTKKALKMVLGSIINQLAIIIVGLILPPLIIQKYGSATNGLINSVKQILNYFSLVSVGLGAAGQIALYKPLARGEQENINGIMSELSRFFDKMSIFFSLLIGIFSFILPIVRKDEIDYFTIFLIVLICGIGSLIEFKCLQKYKILLTADQKQYITSSVNTQGLFTNLVFSVILIHFNAPIVIVQLVATLAYVLRMCLMTVKIKKLYPYLDLKIKDNKYKIPKQKEALFYKTTDIIISYAPMTIVTFIFGFIDASIYSVYNTIFMSIGMVANIFSNGLSSSFGNLLAAGKEKSFRDGFIGYNFVFRTFAFWLYCCAAILIIPFISIYINNNDGINYLLPALGVSFSINGIAKALRTPASTIVDSLGKYNKKNIIFNYIEASLNIIISILASLKLGIVGVLIGGIISSIIRSALFIYDIYKENLKLSYIREYILIVLNFIISVIIYLKFMNITVFGVLEWIKIAVVVALVSGIIIVILNVLLDYKGFKEFYKRAKSIFLLKRDK